MKRTIYVDVDGVLANFDRTASDWIYNRTGVRYDWNNVDKDDTFESWNVEQHVVDQFDEECPIICSMAYEYENAMNTYQRLLDTGHDVFIATAPYHNVDWLSARARWLLDRGIPIKKQCHFSNKGKLDGDILIDDRYKNINAFNNGITKRGILINRKYNDKYTDENSNIYAKMNFDDVPDLIIDLFGRY